MLERCDRTSKSILDVGCGPGSNAGCFSSWEYLGIDHNPKYIEYARTIYPSMRFSVSDATEFGYEDATFDVILINSLLHHLDDEECQELLHRVALVLNQKGGVIVQEPLIPEKHEVLQRFLMSQDRGDHFRSLHQWRKLFGSAGFASSFEEFYRLKVFGLVTGWQMYSTLLKRF